MDQTICNQLSKRILSTGIVITQIHQLYSLATTYDSCLWPIMMKAFMICLTNMFKLRLHTGGNAVRWSQDSVFCPKVISHWSSYVIMSVTGPLRLI